jgi:hypothetical protein
MSIICNGESVCLWNLYSSVIWYYGRTSAEYLSGLLTLYQFKNINLLEPNGYRMH